MEFDKKSCLDNIYALAKEKNVKIGDIEEKAGVSKGYLSRINKEGNTSSPSIEVLLAAAELLGVTVEILVSGNYNGLSANEQYVLKFLDRLIFQTSHNQAVWEKETPKDLDNVGYAYNDEVDHPLFKEIVISTNYDPAGYPDGNITGIVYNSRFFQQGETKITGNAFHTDLEYTSAVLYITKVQNEEEDLGLKIDEYEIYIVDRGTVSPLCSTINTSTEIHDQIINLYKTVENADSNLGVTKDVKNIIDLFMNELPFN